MILKRNMTTEVIQKNNNNNNIETKPNTGLIAGLTSGLVVFALIVLTAAGFVIYRKRKRSKETAIKAFNLPTNYHQNNDSHKDNDLIFPSPPSSLPSLTSKTPSPPPKNITIPPQSLTTNSLKKHDPLGVPPMITTNDHSLLINEKENLTPHYCGSALHIPPLITTPTSIYTSTPHSIVSPYAIKEDDDDLDPTLNNSKNTIQRSLTLNFQSRRPSHQQLSSNNNNNPSSSLNRSASVKVTKYDYPVTRAATSSSISSNFDDDDLDHIQIKRAFSVKRSQKDTNNNNNNQLLKPTIKTISRSNSVKSQHRQSLINNNNNNNNNNEQKINVEDEKEKKNEKEVMVENNSEDDDDDDNEIKDKETKRNTAGSDTIQVISVKPTIARIRSLSRKNQHHQKILEENEENDDDHQKQQQKKQQEQEHHHQQDRISMPVSTHSTLADGEITVYWQS